MSRGNVRRTLHRGLFEKPRVFENKSYHGAMDSLFPLRAEFEHFLRVERDEERIDLSKRLVLALIRSRRFAPPLRLLMNVLNYETKEFSTATVGDTGYIGQDHFVHLVNVYLLGIYIYAYHPQIHKQCRLFLNKLKKNAAVNIDGHNNQAADLITSLNDYELFAEIWSYFVLFHDLAYPIECIDPNKRQAPDYIEFLKPFNNLKKSYLKDLSLKAIANLITLDFLIDEEDALRLDEYLSPFPKFYLLFRATETDKNLPLKPRQIISPLKSNEKDELFKDWKKAVHLNKLKGASALHLLMSFFQAKGIGALLENSDTGEIAIILLGNEKTLSIATPQAPSLLPKRLASFSPNALVEYAFIKAESPIPGFSWEYFARNAKSTFDSIISEIYPSNKESYYELRRYINNKLPFASRVVPGLQSADLTTDFVFEEASRLMGYVDEHESGDELTAAFDRGRRSFVQVADKFSDHLSYCLREAVQESIGDKRLNPFDLLTTTSYPEIVKEVSKIISNLAGESSQVFDREIGLKIKDNIHYYQCVKNCQKILRDRIEKQLGNFQEADFNPFTHVPFQNKMVINRSIFSRTEDELKNLDSRLSRSGLYHFDKLLLSYCTPLARSTSVDPEKENFIDHGLSAAIVGIASVAFYKRCYQEILKHSGPKVPVGIKALRLAFVIGSKEEDYALELGLNHLLAESIAAVAMHNLYPKNLGKGNEGFRTSLSSNPFAYLCILTDSLQIWDRRKILNQALADLPLGFNSNDINIGIEGNHILISAKGDKVNVSEFDRKYREGLSGFLKGADHLIRLQVMET